MTSRPSPAETRVKLRAIVRGDCEWRWRLMPHFTKDLKKCTPPINARAETVATSGMFRGALAARRCLVPADAFYEWKAMPDGKQPYAIARTDGAPLALAGLWEGWRGPDGETLRTFTIITTEANPDMARLHNRMPVILEATDWPAWLGEAVGVPGDLFRPAAEGVVRLWPVSRAANSVRNNGAGLLDSLGDPGAPRASAAPATFSISDRWRRTSTRAHDRSRTPYLSSASSSRIPILTSAYAISRRSSPSPPLQSPRQITSASAPAISMRMRPSSAVLSPRYRLRSSHFATVDQGPSVMECPAMPSVSSGLIVTDPHPNPRRRPITAWPASWIAVCIRSF
jgi:putative SOS response-associated peptidase YedK